MTMVEISTPMISVIVPTRGRPQQLASFLDSVSAMTHRLDRLEVILVVDNDDRSCDDVEQDGLTLRLVEIAPGRSMSELNRAGYEVAAGDYLMLLNDDVVLRTPGWDDQARAAFRTFDDGIVLVHVNDRLFEHRLCTFPFLTRAFCEVVGGICPPGYERYRIDDHIYNVFNLLNVLGKDRILYLPDVVFEHHNYILNARGKIEYQPDEEIHARDTDLFDALLPERKALAVRLAGIIDEHRRRDVPQVRQEALVPISDSVSLRRLEYVRFWYMDRPPESATTRVTIGVVSADLRAPHVQACLAAIKKFTRNFDLIVVDNNRAAGFNHSREMNRLIDMSRTDYLVLMDDDVIVEAGWLDGMLRCMSSTVGVVTPLHKSADGVLSYAGVVMSPDYSGNHNHALYVGDDAFPIQTLCSAIMLIDLSKCGHLRLDESYSKYFLDIDYGLRVWECGLAVVCSPHTLVTHLGGATFTQGSRGANRLFEKQRKHFVESWMRTGRYVALEESASWRGCPAISAILEAPNRLEEFLDSGAPADQPAFLKQLEEFFAWLQYYPALQRWARKKVGRLAESQRSQSRLEDASPLATIAGYLGHQVLVHASLRGFNVVFWNGTYYAIPAGEGPFVPRRAEKGGYGQHFQANSPELLQALIAAELADADNPFRHGPLQANRGAARTVMRSLFSAQGVMDRALSLPERVHLALLSHPRSHTAARKVYHRLRRLGTRISEIE